MHDEMQERVDALSDRIAARSRKIEGLMGWIRGALETGRPDEAIVVLDGHVHIIDGHGAERIRTAVRSPR